MTAHETKKPTRKPIGRYREFVVPTTLAPFFDYLWVYEGEKDPGPCTCHRVLPDPDSSFVLRANWLSRPPPHGTEIQFHGPILNPFLYRPMGGEILIGAKIKSEWLLPLLGTRGDELANYSGPLKGIDRALSDRLLVGLEKSALLVKLR